MFNTIIILFSFVILFYIFRFFYYSLLLNRSLKKRMKDVSVAKLFFNKVNIADENIKVYRKCVWQNFYLILSSSVAFVIIYVFIKWKKLF